MNGPRYFKLIGKLPVPCEDMMEWAMWLNTANEARRVAVSQTDAFCVSTVFLGLDHSFIPGDPPALFETMIFYSGTTMDHYAFRCETWDQAEAQHATALELALKEQAKLDTFIEKVLTPEEAPEQKKT